jgi:hypothetical protein
MYVYGMDSYFIFNIRQDLQDHQDFSFLSQFPQETEKTQSDFVGNGYLINVSTDLDLNAKISNQ